MSINKISEVNCFCTEFDIFYLSERVDPIYQSERNQLNRRLFSKTQILFSNQFL